MSNPFVWDRPLDAAASMGRHAHARRVAEQLASGSSLALLGAHGTGKTTFTHQVQAELARMDDPLRSVYFDFDHAFSWEALALAVLSGADQITHQPLRAHVASRLAEFERSSGVNLQQLRAGERPARATPIAWQQLVNSVLAAIADYQGRCVVIIDELQKLAAWMPQDRAAILTLLAKSLMKARVPLLVTGSHRDGLRSLLESWTKQIRPLELPRLDAAETMQELGTICKRSGRPLEKDAAQAICELARLHPRRMQQLAWHAWNGSETQIDLAAVKDAYSGLISSEGTDFAQAVQILGITDERLRRVLYMVADNNGERLQSEILAERYGIGASGRMAIKRDLQKLSAMALIEQDAKSGSYVITDPFLHAWLRRHSPYS